MSSDYTENLRAATRRHFFSQCSMGLGSLALGSLMSDNKLLAAPSLGGESFGMVLARAFGCATPVVASDIPGYARVMAPEVGLTVPPGDPGALAEAIVSLLEDEPRRQALGAAARARALKRYAWSRLARRLLDIYAELLPIAAPRECLSAEPSAKI